MDASKGCYNKTMSRPVHMHKAGVAPHFRKAGLLDLPFIFNQIMEGAVDGAFTERFLTAKGNLHLFRLLFLNLLPFNRLLGKYRIYDFLMFQRGEDDLGFVGIHTGHDDGNTTVGFYGIANEHRGKKYGSWMMASLIEYLPADARIAVYTTEYSVAMQHILLKAGFKRTPSPQGSKAKFFILSRHKPEN